jgi:CRP-like cAMP-binding protein
MKSILQSGQSFERTRQLLNTFSPLEEKDWLHIKKSLEQKLYKKGDFFIKEGQPCNTIGFLITGIARVYYLIDGKEITSYFNTDNRNILVCSFTSFLSRKPSFEIIQFLEDTELLVLNYDQLNLLYEKSPAIQRLGRLMAEHNYVLSMERIYSLQHLPAVERYTNMLKIYPGLLNQIPHHFIASYLGITPESLSRIRKDVSKKKI